MKKKSLVLLQFSLVLCLHSVKTIGQTALPLSAGSLIQNLDSGQVLTPRQLLSKADSIVQVSYPNDSAEAGPRNCSRRITEFWLPRVENTRSSDSIQLPYMKALKKAMSKTDDYIGCAEFRGNWENIGPKTDNPNSQCQGPIYKVWSDPTNPNIVLVGTEGAGLWRTTNANAQDVGSTVKWTNITDNSPFQGTMGITALAVNPTNSSEIYIGVGRWPMWGFVGFNKSGFGLWHTTDGGLNWVLESSGLIGTPLGLNDFISVDAIEFAPYKVGGNDMLVFTSGRFVFGKVGNAAWVNLTPDCIDAPTLTAAGTLTVDNMNDIEFAHDKPGKIILSCSQKSGDNIQHRRGIFLLEFNPLTGAPLATVAGASPAVIPRELFDETLGGSLPVIGHMSWRIEIEYEANGKFYIAYSIMGTSTNSAISWANGQIYVGKSDFTATTLPASGFTHLWGPPYGIPPTVFNENQAIMAFAASKTEELLYIAGTTPLVVYKDAAGAWQYKNMYPYGLGLMHADVRDIHIAVDASTTAAGLGLNQIVYYATDGGISRVKDIDVTLQANALATIQNINGDNLYISPMTDVDASDYGHYITGAAWHNGAYRKGTFNGLWQGGLGGGDGIQYSIDRQLSNNDKTVLYYKNQVSLGDATPNDNLTGSAGLPYQKFVGGIVVPQYLHPQEAANSVPVYKEESFGYQRTPFNPGSHNGLGLSRFFERSFLTNPIAGVFDPAKDYDMSHPINVPSDTMDPLAKYPLFAKWYRGKKSCRNFYTATLTNSSAQGIAYILNQAPNLDDIGGQNGQLNRAYKISMFDINWNANNFLWDWCSGNWLPETSVVPNRGKDITPPQCNGTSARFLPADFAVDPENPKRILLALSGINWQRPGENRVLISEDAGDTWDDYSEGLTELPVNCIVYQKGQNGVAYLGCDDGVYYRATTMNKWCKLNMAKGGGRAPNVNVTHLKIDYCSGKLMAATCGRGIWVSDLIANNPVNWQIAGVTKVVGGLEVWPDTRFIEGSLLIKTGATLQITGTATNPTLLHMGHRGRIYVEKGAKLIVNNATITNNCGYWMGIQVSGDKASPQVIASNGLDANHGIVILGEANIVNAEEGFTNADEDGNSGGIIQAHNSNFINCRRSAQFIQYQNGPNADLSFFSNCTFKVGDGMPWPFERHITMWDVHGVKISSCNFYNNQADNIDHRRAISSLNASYIANYCLFNGFWWAICAENYTSDLDIDKTITLEYNTFENNAYGIVVSNCPRLEFRHNNVEIGNLPTSQPEDGDYDPAATHYYGVGSKLFYTQPWLFHHNNFYADNVGMPNNSTNMQPMLGGSEFIHGGSYNINIKRNTYSELDAGTIIFGTNGTPSNTGRSFGLIFTCNDNVGNNNDYLLFDDAYINRYQVASSINGDFSASNTYSNGAAHHWFASPQTQWINYSFDGTQPAQNPMIQNTLVLYNNLQPYQDCDLAPNGKRIRFAADLAGAKLRFDSLSGLYSSITAILNSSIDDGNTNSLKNDIEITPLNQANLVRTELLALSPFVSKDVLLSTAYKNILSPLVLTEVLMANPDATKDEKFMYQLEHNIPSTLTPYMLQMVRNSWQGLTYRSALERTASNAYGEMKRLQASIMQCYATDSTLRNSDSSASWRAVLPDVAIALQLADYLVEQHQYSAGLACLTDLANAPNYTENDDIEIQAAKQLLLLKQAVYTAGHNMNKLDSAEYQNLVNIAANPVASAARKMARGIMCFFYDSCIAEPRTNLNSNNASRIAKPSKISTNTKSSTAVAVAPSPATNIASFVLNLQPDEVCASLLISDIQGKEVYKSVLPSSIKLHNVDVQNLQSGQYTYLLRTSYKTYSGRFVVQH
jgi:hypothetical protein